MFKTVKPTLIFVFSIIAISSLNARETKPVQPCLPHLTEQTADFNENRNTVSVLAKTLSAQECQSAFGEKYNTLINGETPLIPIQLSIHNANAKKVQFSSKYLSMPVATNKEVENVLCPLEPRQKRSAILWMTVGTLIGAIAGCAIVFTGFIGTFLLGMPFLFPAATILCWAGAIWIGGALTLTPLCIGIYEIQSKNLEEVVKSRMHSYVVLRPGESKEMLIFVHKKDFKPNFELTLKSRKRSDYQTFQVSVKTPDYEQHNV